MTAAGCCNTINNRGEVVLFSADAMGNMRALLWKNGVMTTSTPSSRPARLGICRLLVRSMMLERSWARG